MNTIIVVLGCWLAASLTIGPLIGLFIATPDDDELGQ